MIEILYKDNYKSLLGYATRHAGDTFVWVLVEEKGIYYDLVLPKNKGVFSKRIMEVEFFNA